MKRNTSLLTEQVRTRLMNKCVTAIVTEAFIKALPFDKEELANESTNIASYAANVIGKMHPETLLDRAMESTKHNQKAHLYVQNLKDAIESVVDIATKRIVHESLTTDNIAPEVVAQTKLNSDETEKMVQASKQSGIDAVAKLVKDKMIDVIKDERNAYEEEVKLRGEIKDVIRQENDELKASIANNKEDEALESYLNLILAPTDARRHISVFSKMQDVCMEAVMHSTEEYIGEIPYQTMEKITLESTFNYFDLSNRSIMEELSAMSIITESATDVECNDEMFEKKKKKIAKTAFICSICIMTLLETLKTMHLAKPELSDVKNFVDNNTDIKNITKTNLKNIEDKVTIATNDAKKSVALGAYNTLELAQAKESLEKVKGMLDKMIVTESEMDRKNRIINKINSALEAMSNDNTQQNVTVTGHFVNRLREENMANLDHCVKLISNKPMVQNVVISLRSDIKCAENSKVEVEIRGNDASGACVATHMITIHALPEFGQTVAEVIRECANYCDLGPKAVKMYFTDSGYTVPLKG